MTGPAVAVLLAAAAFCLWGWTPTGSMAGRAAMAPVPAPRFRRDSPLKPDGDAPALLVRELSGLLAAGRSRQRLWADAASLYAGRSRAGTHPFLPVLQAAAAAAELGLSPAPAFSSAAAADSKARAHRRRTGHAARNAGVPGPPGQDGHHWAGLAACVRVSERSGAPLAGVLSRYAGQLDDSRDAAADRAAALAGPRATVRLLTWLPAAGMGLGYLLGGNPLQILTGTPAGWAAAGAGSVLWLAGRLWAGRMVRTAADPAKAASQE